MLKATKGAEPRESPAPFSLSDALFAWTVFTLVIATGV